jgi:hypothetical protein
MPNDFGFDKKSAQRVVDATRAYERNGLDTVAGTVLPLPQQRMGFWAKLTASTAFSDNANRWKYSWTREFKSDEAFTDDSFSGSDTGIDYAINTLEANNPSSGGTYAPIATSPSPVVWMHYEFVNISGTVEPRYGFEAVTWPPSATTGGFVDTGGGLTTGSLLQYNGSHWVPVSTTTITVLTGDPTIVSGHLVFTTANITAIVNSTGTTTGVSLTGC